MLEVRVVSGPSVEAIGESIRGRSGAPGSKLFGEEDVAFAFTGAWCMQSPLASWHAGTVLTSVFKSLDCLGRSGLTERRR